MRHFRIRVFVLICICFAYGTSFAKEQLVEVVNTANLIKLTYNFAVPEIQTENGISIVTVNGVGNIGEPGNPLLPVYPSQIVLPQGATVKSFSVNGKAIGVDGKYVIKHANFLQPLSAFDKTLVTPQNEEIYNLKSAYPAQLGYAKNVGKKFGYSILPFNLNPVSYIPADGKISYYKELTVSIELSYDKNAANGALVAEPTEVQLNDLYAIADDISSVKTYTVNADKSKNLTLPALLFDYVVIMPEDFDEIAVNNLMTYHRNYNDYSITNVTIEWIESSYTGTRPDGGTDTQTKIREFVDDAYRQWGIRYIMMVGGESIIPCRKLHAEVNLGDSVAEIPADMYFGCLDGTFDYNANGVYGESDDGVDGDDVDLFAEVYVGRAAVASSEEFSYLVNKIIAYGTDEYDEYLRAVHMLGGYLAFGGVSDYAKGMMEQIRLGGTYDGYTTKGFADSVYADQYDLDVNLYDEDAVWSGTDLLTLMNDGTHMFNHLGHANPTYSMKLNNSDLDSLSNDKYFFIYSQGCQSGWFDNLSQECFAQKITRMESGAFGVIMNSRYGWGAYNSTDGPSQKFARWFWNYGLGNYDKKVNDGRMLEPGVANQLSKEILISQIDDNGMRWTTYELNLFGDPAAPFRLNAVSSYFIMDQTEVNSTNLVEVGVFDPNLLVSNLMVTVESYTNFVSLVDRGPLSATADVDMYFNVASQSFKTNIILADVLTPAPTHGDTIVYTYYGAEDPSSSTNIYYVMTVDNMPLEVSDISVDNVALDSAQIKFNTDAPVTGSILYGTNVPPTLTNAVPLSSIVDQDTGLIDNNVKLSSLDMETVYYFAIVVSDEAGNITSVPVDALSTDPDDYHKFVTAGIRLLSSYNFVEDGPLDWTHDGLNDSWAFGEVFGYSNLIWSLDGWQTGLNVPYTLPCNTWLSSPFITSTDIAYVDVTYELELASGAIVYLEGDDGNGWQTLDVLPETDVSTVRFNIQALDTSKPFKLRFRLLSNSGTTSARGLSVFAVNLIKELSDGIFIKDYTVDDSTAISGNNNNNGHLEAGETVNLEISSINLSQNIIPNVRGTIDLPSPNLSITNGNTINYGEMDIGETVTASGYITVVASSDYDPEAETSYLLQTALSVGTTNSWVDKVQLYVEGTVVPEPESLTFTAEALGGVTNWLGEALEGDGSDNSAIYQMIYAGADGVPNAPSVSGGTTGDDVIMLRSFDGTSFGYFGYGVFAYPDKGRFVDEFDVSQLAAGDVVYIRAWDSSSIAASVAYGDSSLYTISYEVDEQHDFYAWAVGSVINYPGEYGMQPEDLADKDRDSIVDGFAVKYGFEAENPIEKLNMAWTNSDATITYDGLGTPTRVVVGTNGYVYVTVSAADVHYIAIYDEDLSLIKTYSNPASPFDNPQGIAFDEINSRLIVADTDKNRVVVLSVQDGTNITWLSTFGSKGDDDGQFTSPYDVAVGSGGKIYVADSQFGVDDCHNRISVFTMDGDFDANIGTIYTGIFDKPLGVTFDDCGNMYVADFANERIQCLSSNSNINLWTLDLPELSSKWGNGAQDLSVVTYWYDGDFIKRRMFIADYYNSRVLVYSISTQYGSPVYETSLGMYGSQPGYFKKPEGIFVSDGYAYIADTDNDRVQKLEIVLDIDQDGMEDTWEDVNGLDSTVNDALDDPDGDGLYNIGEFRIKTEPLNRDTDGDGVSDGQETIMGTSPWVIDSLAITAIIGGNGSLSFPALAGGIYRLEYVAGLMLPRNWLNGGLYTATTDGILTIALPGWGTTMMFYRVIWTNPDFN
jgi:hypothetical protein